MQCALCIGFSCSIFPIGKLQGHLACHGEIGKPLLMTTFQNGLSLPSISLHIKGTFYNVDEEVVVKEVAVEENVTGLLIE